MTLEQKLIVVSLLIALAVFVILMLTRPSKGDRAKDSGRSGGSSDWDDGDGGDGGGD